MSLPAPVARRPLRHREAAAPGSAAAESGAAAWAAHPGERTPACPQAAGAAPKVAVLGEALVYGLLLLLRYQAIAWHRAQFYTIGAQQLCTALNISSLVALQPAQEDVAELAVEEPSHAYAELMPQRICILTKVVHDLDWLLGLQELSKSQFEGPLTQL
eukprot:CAMPEP_0115100764 /NCGR_PEP_ID=MMETSP0227-20121206/32785_1 /TAXON_ID=89957 /ORGANISM="Polarella glacialis, Strain CCMP 1383" /LENGTH=158 /DNA_ID=CAMNT_0002496295 /DNA_START=354 /DNA_END=831 /DNA_ORIENTATION=+